MTAHEVFTALFWIVAGGYLLYLGWFAWTAIRRRPTGVGTSGAVAEPRRERTPRHPWT